MLFDGSSHPGSSRVYDNKVVGIKESIGASEDAPDKSLLLVAISFGNRSRGIGQSLTDDVGNHGRPFWRIFAPVDITALPPALSHSEEMNGGSTQKETV